MVFNFFKSKYNNIFLKHIKLTKEKQNNSNYLRIYLKLLAIALKCPQETKDLRHELAKYIKNILLTF